MLSPHWWSRKCSEGEIFKFSQFFENFDENFQDADECIKDDKQYHKGLYQRAEALYQMGHFEHGLIFFHRGHALRPELDQFRLGIQKCQEAIENSGADFDISKVNFRQKLHTIWF